MPEEHHPTVEEEAQLAVGRLQRGQVLGAEVGVEVAGLNARELGHVVHDLLLRRNVVVDERFALSRALAGNGKWTTLHSILQDNMQQYGPPS